MVCGKQTIKLFHCGLPQLLVQPHLTYHTSDKVAIFIQMEQYVEITEDYQLQDKPFGPKISGIRYMIFLIRAFAVDYKVHAYNSAQSAESAKSTSLWCTVTPTLPHLLILINFLWV